MASGSQSISCPVKKPRAKVCFAVGSPASRFASRVHLGQRQPAWSRKALPAAVSSTPRTLRDSSSARPRTPGRESPVSEGCEVWPQLGGRRQTAFLDTATK